MPGTSSVPPWPIVLKPWNPPAADVPGTSNCSPQQAVGPWLAVRRSDRTRKAGFSYLAFTQAGTTPFIVMHIQTLSLSLYICIHNVFITCFFYIYIDRYRFRYRYRYNECEVAHLLYAHQMYSRGRKECQTVAFSEISFCCMVRFNSWQHKTYHGNHDMSTHVRQPPCTRSWFALFWILA